MLLPYKSLYLNNFSPSSIPLPTQLATNLKKVIRKLQCFNLLYILPLIAILSEIALQLFISSMKNFLLILLLATLATFTYSQDVLAKPHSNTMQPPIAIYEAETLDIEVKTDVEKKVEPQPTPKMKRQPIMLGKEENNPSNFIPEQKFHERKGREHRMGGHEQNKIHPTHMPLLGQEQFNPSNFVPLGPMPGEQQFNPSNFFPGRQPHQSSWDGKKQGKHDFKKRHGQMRRQGEMPPSPLDYEGWENHIQRNHMNKRFHRKTCFMFALTAVIFTMFGICLGKCFRKCKKRKEKQMKQFALRMKNSNHLAEEIKEKERKLQELKNQYRMKRAQEQRAAEERRQDQMRFIEMRQQRPMYPNVQPYVAQNQACFYNPRNQIPVGRPLEESGYPQL